MAWLASISVIATACNGGKPSSSTFLFDGIKLKRLTRLDLSYYSSTGTTQKVEEEKEEEEEESRHGLETWQVWALFILGVVILFLIAYIVRLKLLASKSSKREGVLQEIDRDHDHDQETQSPVMKDVVVKAEEDRRSELEFFVEREEWFTVEELMEGVADLRSHGLYSGLYVVRLKNDAVYAVKRLRKLKVSMEEFGVAMRRAGKLRHPNILPLVGFNNTLQEKLLIYTFQPHGSLLNLFHSYAQGERAFPWKLRLSIAVGIARGLDFIYRNDDGVSPHGMIKLSNVMLSDEYEPLISEYGYAEFLDPTGPCRLSMKGYAAPEKTVTEKSDVYSFGVILLELLTGKVVEKSGLDLPRWVRSVVREEWTGEVFDDKISDVGMYAFPLLNVSLKCVAVHVDERPTIAQVLQKIEEVVSAQQD